MTSPLHQPIVETISAVATPSGQGGVGVIRLSGPHSSAIAKALTQQALPAPRLATLVKFRAAPNEAAIDRGLLLYFPAPNSYTGEDVIELHAHGGPVVLDMLLQVTLQHGARQARPGEFTERAFVNGKIDLAQAEAVADLIAARSESAAKSASRSREGALSRKVGQLAEQLAHLRAYVEASIDFPDEELELMQAGQVAERSVAIEQACALLSREAEQGVMLTEGLRTVLVGAPNVGKSSLLNALCGTDAALVTPIPGTTRDVIREQVQINGLPLVLMDTAGLRETDDLVEQMGNERARGAVQTADLVLIVTDCEPSSPSYALPDLGELHAATLIIRNKVDLSIEQPGLVADDQSDAPTRVRVSATTGAGLENLREAIHASVGFQQNNAPFAARRRHLRAFKQTEEGLQRVQFLLAPFPQLELVAEELRLAHETVQTVTGRFSTEDLLGEIFSTFCIGK